MRIRSGGPQGTQGTQKTQKSSASSSAQAAKFAGMVGSAGSSTDQQSAGKDQMMAALQALAAELEAGTATKEEASRRFVGLVIEQRFGQQSGKGMEAMQTAVGDMVEADPQFVARLQSQLKRLAKS